MRIKSQKSTPVEIEQRLSFKNSIFSVFDSPSGDISPSGFQTTEHSTKRITVASVQGGPFQNMLHPVAPQVKLYSHDVAVLSTLLGNTKDSQP